MDKLYSFRTFIEVARQGSLVKAASNLHLTVPAISKQIAALEQFYSTTLFFREQKGLKLTDAGQRFFQTASELLTVFEQSERGLYGGSKQVAGRLKIVASHFFAQKVILPKIAAFCERYPDIQLSLDIAERIPNMEREDLDIVGGMSVMTGENVLRRSIGNTRYVLCATKEYLKKHPKITKLEDLANHRFLTHSIRKDPAKLLLGEEELSVNNPFVVNDSMLLLHLLRSGFGVGQILEYFITDDLQKGGLIEIFPKKKSLEVPILLYIRKTPIRLDKVECFLNFFVPED